MAGVDDRNAYDVLKEVASNSGRDVLDRALQDKYGLTLDDFNSKYKTQASAMPYGQFRDTVLKKHRESAAPAEPLTYRALREKATGNEFVGPPPEAAPATKLYVPPSTMSPTVEGTPRIVSDQEMAGLAGSQAQLQAVQDEKDKDLAATRAHNASLPWYAPKEPEPKERTYPVTDPRAHMAPTDREDFDAAFKASEPVDRSEVSIPKSAAQLGGGLVGLGAMAGKTALLAYPHIVEAAQRSGPSLAAQTGMPGGEVVVDVEEARARMNAPDPGKTTFESQYDAQLAHLDDEYEKALSKTAGENLADDFKANIGGFAQMAQSLTGFKKYLPEQTTADALKEGWDASTGLAPGMAAMATAVVKHPGQILDKPFTSAMVLLPGLTAARRGLQAAGKAVPPALEGAFQAATKIAQAAEDAASVGERAVNPMAAAGAAREAVRAKPGEVRAGEPTVSPETAARVAAGEAKAVEPVAVVEPVAPVVAPVVPKKARGKAQAVVPAVEPTVSPAAQEPIPEPSWESPARATPEHVNAKTWYHGSGTENLHEGMINPGMTNEAGLVGPGLYLTDSPEIAAGYAKARGARSGKQIIYEASTALDKPVLDFDKPLPDPVYDRIMEQANRWSDEVGGAESKPPPRTASGMEVWKHLQEVAEDYSHETRTPKSEMAEPFWDIGTDLRALGYEGMTHTGGLRVGGGKTLHQVLVLFDPADSFGTGGAKALKSLRPRPEPRATTATVAPEPIPLSTYDAASEAMRQGKDVPEPPPHTDADAPYIDPRETEARAIIAAADKVRESWRGKDPATKAIRGIIFKDEARSRLYNDYARAFKEADAAIEAGNFDEAVAKAEQGGKALTQFMDAIDVLATKNGNVHRWWKTARPDLNAPVPEPAAKPVAVVSEPAPKPPAPVQTHQERPRYEQKAADLGWGPDIIAKMSDEDLANVALQGRSPGQAPNPASKHETLRQPGPMPDVPDLYSDSGWAKFRRWIAGPTSAESFTGMVKSALGLAEPSQQSAQAERARIAPHEAAENVRYVGQEMAGAVKRMKDRGVVAAEPAPAFITDPESGNPIPIDQWMGARRTRVLTEGENGTVVRVVPETVDLEVHPETGVASRTRIGDLEHQLSQAVTGSVDPNVAKASPSLKRTELLTDIIREKSPDTTPAGAATIIRSDPRLRMTTNFGSSPPHPDSLKLLKQYDGMLQAIGMTAAEYEGLRGENVKDPGFLNYINGKFGVQVKGPASPRQYEIVRREGGETAPAVEFAIREGASKFRPVETPPGGAKQFADEVSRKARKLGLEPADVQEAYFDALSGESPVYLANDGVRKRVVRDVVGALGLQDKGAIKAINTALQRLVDTYHGERQDLPTFVYGDVRVTPDQWLGFMSDHISPAKLKELHVAAVSHFYEQKVQSGNRIAQGEGLWQLAFEPFSDTRNLPHSASEYGRSIAEEFLVRGKVPPPVLFGYTGKEIATAIRADVVGLAERIAARTGQKAGDVAMRLGELGPLLSYLDNFEGAADSIRTRMIENPINTATWKGGGRTRTADVTIQKDPLTAGAVYADPFEATSIAHAPIQVAPFFNSSVGSAWAFNDSMSVALLTSRLRRFESRMKTGMTALSSLPLKNNLAANTIIGILQSGSASFLTDMAAGAFGRLGEVSPQARAEMEMWNRALVASGVRSSHFGHVEVAPLAGQSPIAKYEKAHRKAYSWADYGPKEALTLAQALETRNDLLNTLPPASAAELPGASTVVYKTGDGVLKDVPIEWRGHVLKGQPLPDYVGRVIYDPREPTALQTQTLADLVTKAASKPSQSILLDLRAVPLALEWARTHPITTSLVTPFLSWRWGTLDIPGVKRGMIANIISPPEVIGRTSSKALNNALAARAGLLAFRRLAIEAGIWNSVEHDRDKREALGLLNTAFGGSVGPLLVANLADDGLDSASADKMNPLSSTTGALNAFFLGKDNLERWMRRNEVRQYTADELAALPPQEKERLRSLAALQERIASGRWGEAKDVLGIVGLSGGLLAPLVAKAAAADARHEGIDLTAFARSSIAALLGGTVAHVVGEAILPAAVAGATGTDVDTAVREYPWLKLGSSYRSPKGQASAQYVSEHMVRAIFGIGLRSERWHYEDKELKSTVDLRLKQFADALKSSVDKNAALGHIKEQERTHPGSTDPEALNKTKAMINATIEMVRAEYSARFKKLIGGTGADTDWITPKVHDRLSEEPEPDVVEPEAMPVSP